MRMIAEFEKKGRLKWFSHLDLQRSMLRALRRAKLPVQYSKGFNPHANLSFASALSVGLESGCEIMDINMEEEMAPEAFVQAMNAILPPDLTLLRAKLVDDRAPAPMALMKKAVYVCTIGEDISSAAAAFLAADKFETEKRSKKGVRMVDIRPMVYDISLEKTQNGCVATLSLCCTNADNLKPELLLQQLCKGEDYSIRRAALLAENDQNLFDAVG